MLNSVQYGVILINFGQVVTSHYLWHYAPVAYTGISFGGVQQIQFRTEDKDDGDLGAVAP